ncbi:MAG: hypothetical protein JO247_18490 [Chloroflexi bacterium]|nr:hypothetical protein [Chloroflexota bacterium]
MANRPSRRRTTATSKGSSAKVLELAQRIVLLAREQKDALERGATSQFELLSQRRESATIELQTLAQGGYAVDDGTAERVAGLQRELAGVDEAMQTFVVENMKKLRAAGNAVKRFHRTVNPYLTAGPRVPSFVDKNT